MIGSASFPALGSTATILTADGSALDVAAAAVSGTVEAFDVACSRFRTDSELSALNRLAGRPVRSGGLLREAVAAAIRAAELTDGDVDPTLGRTLTALGYDRDFGAGLDDCGAVPDARRARARRPRGRVSVASAAGWRTVEVDDAAETIRTAPRVSLDLGATAKALCSDHAAAAAHAVAGCGVLVSLGGDVAIAGEAPQEGWRVRVTDDHRATLDAPGQWITLRSGGLATSSTTVRRWHRRGRSVHHLLDPADGRPADSGWRTASVVAATCLDANIASTASIIRGERALPWLIELGLPARLVSDAGTVVHVAGWTAEGDDLPARVPADVDAQVPA